MCQSPTGRSKASLPSSNASGAVYPTIGATELDASDFSSTSQTKRFSTRPPTCCKMSTDAYCHHADSCPRKRQVRQEPRPYAADARQELAAIDLLDLVV